MQFLNSPVTYGSAAFDTFLQEYAAGRTASDAMLSSPVLTPLMLLAFFVGLYGGVNGRSI